MEQTNLHFSAIIFDLDGVLVDTAHFHYLSWKKLAAQWGFHFSESDNEQLKGVSRLASLDLLLGFAGKQMSETEKQLAMALKNDWYLELVETLKPNDLLPGVLAFLEQLKQNNIKIGLGSASKNAKLILDKCKITSYFDVISDGTNVTNAKPDPEVFLYAAKHLGLQPQQCVVVEDSQAGIDAALVGNFLAIGLGLPENLKNAHRLYTNLAAMSANDLINDINQTWIKYNKH